MLDTLFHIPHEFFGIPVFGVGWALGIWIVFGVAMTAVGMGRGAGTSDWKNNLPLFVVVALVIWLALPQVEERGFEGEPLGLPIRGFGTMVMLGAISGVAMMMYRAKQMGADLERLSSLAFVACVAGFVGARAFYVTQYFDDFRRDSVMETVKQLLKFTEGGMVIYGGVLGGFAAGILYAWRYRMPILPSCDLIAPSLAIGMAIGRLGCFCHGCCFAGACDPGVCTVQFPQGSPPYWHQFRRGQLHGIRIEAGPDGTPTVGAVEPDSAAAKASVVPGGRIVAIRGRPVTSLKDAYLDPSADFVPEISLTMADGVEYRWSVSTLPPRAKPVQPVQLFSFVSSLALCAVLWTWYPFRRRDGENLGLLMLMYPIARTLEEMIRDDEAGKFGTSLTISQWISLGLLAGSLGVWAYVLRKPPGILRPLSPNSGTFESAPSSEQVTRR
ncbi:MAG: hypothetical protein RIS70_3032 [Planctomycetota bacterium]|jgi:phosphatidylglycerol:prolipoprotein diacylglycerol transferase